VDPLAALVFRIHGGEQAPRLPGSKQPPIEAVARVAAAREIHPDSQRAALPVVRAAQQRPAQAASAFSGGAEDTQAHLSPLARLIAALPRSAEPVRVLGCLLPQPSGEARVLERALARALERSGLFYESHLAQWIAGERERARLLEEPQARGEPSAARPATNSGPEASPEPGPAPAAREPDEGAYPLALAARQLQVLEQGAIALCLELWAGQFMRWQIAAAAHEDSGSNRGERRWYTRLELELPRLQALRARLALQGDCIEVRVGAHEEASGRLLAARQEELVGALRAAGFTTVRVAFSDYETT
jgi:hypothetical protein